MYRSVEKNGAEHVVRFDDAEEGLISKTGENVAGFEIAGADGKFHPAEARIEGNSVRVWSPQVPAPEQARYLWINQPAAVSLYGRNGLPAAPFWTAFPKSSP